MIASELVADGTADILPHLAATLCGVAELPDCSTSPGTTKGRLY